TPCGSPTPTPTATATATVTASATPTATATATVTASATPTATATATETPRSTPTPRPRPTPAPHRGNCYLDSSDCSGIPNLVTTCFDCLVTGNGMSWQTAVGATRRVRVHNGKWNDSSGNWRAKLASSPSLGNRAPGSWESQAVRIPSLAFRKVGLTSDLKEKKTLTFSSLVE